MTTSHTIGLSGRLCAAALALFCAGGLAGAAVAPESVSLAADAQSFQYLMPPVVVKGEPLSMTALADTMAKYKLPGVSAAYIHGGAIAWTFQAGLTRKGGVSITADTLFQVGALGQQVTAMAVMALVGEGKLDLDRDVNDYLKSWKIPGSTLTAQAKVTLRELLIHRGGLNAIDNEGYPRGERMPTLRQVLEGRAPAKSATVAVEKVPGTFSLGHAADYLVVQRVLEDVTGEAFAVFARRTVLEPLGMLHSTFEQEPSDSRLAQAAWPHDKDGAPTLGGPRNFPEEAAWGLWSTAPDMARFALEIQADLAGEGKGLLSRELARELMKPEFKDIVELAKGTVVGGDPRNPWFGITELTAGYAATLRAYEQGDGVVILSNGDNGLWLNEQFVNTVAGTHGWPDFGPRKEKGIATLPARVLDRYVGQYLIQGPFGEPDFRVNVTRDGGHLWVQGSGQYPFEEYPRNGREFFAKVAPISTEFETDKAGKALALRVHQGGETFDFKRIADSIYRHAKPGTVVPRTRSFLTMDQSVVAKDSIWCDSYYNESMTAKVDDGHFVCVFESGKRWGCANFLRSNVGPFVKDDVVDLAGYDRMLIKAKGRKGLKFWVSLSEAGSWDPGVKRYAGPDGADGESWKFTGVEGTGSWKTYTFELAQARRRAEVDNQAGNDILDLEAIANVGLNIEANQGEGSLAVASITFAKD
jgi:CubicO group peptidase (beta-lactamase class C family)